MKHVVKHRTGAFTLVELLVVIAIIAMLLSILMPSLSKAREGAARAVCASNNHQIMLACMAYAENNKNYYPMWYGSSPCAPDTSLFLNNYVPDFKAFQCPYDKSNYGTLPSNACVPIQIGLSPKLDSAIKKLGPVSSKNEVTARTPGNRRSYSFNLNYCGWLNYCGLYPDGGAGQNGWTKTTDIKRSSQTIIITEAHHLWNIVGCLWNHGYYGPLPPNVRSTDGYLGGYSHNPGWALYNWSKSGKFAHGNGAVFGFADGHAEFIKVDIKNEVPSMTQYDEGWYTNYRWP